MFMYHVMSTNYMGTNDEGMTFHLSNKDYWLRKNSFKPDILGEYCLTYRINMEYKGKPDQEGVVFMFISEYEIDKFIRAGFQEISGGDDPTDFTKY